MSRPTWPRSLPRCRRGAERVRRVHPGLGAAEYRAQPLSPALPAVPRDLAQARRVRPDGHPDRGRRDRSRRGRHRDLPAVRHAGRGRAGQALPAGLGHVHLGLLRPPGAVRVLLLRRSGADGRALRRQLRPRALQGRRPRIPGSRLTARLGPKSGFADYYRTKLGPGGGVWVMSKGTVILFLWLIIGAAAAGQRGYFSTTNLDCTSGATMALTIVAGPLNYVGLKPKISCPAPKPSGA